MSIPKLDPFQVIADPSRRQMLQLLSQQPLHINALAEQFDMSRPAVSKHVKILHNAGFIAVEERGRERYCTLRQKGFKEIRNWINYYDKFWHEKVGRLNSLLDKEAEKTRKR